MSACGPTHHLACDCRESAHAEEVARLRETFKAIEELIRVPGDPAAILLAVRARIARAALEGKP